MPSPILLLVGTSWGSPDTFRRKLATRCWTLCGPETRWGDAGRSRVAGSAHCWQETDIVRAGVRSQRSEDAVVAESDAWHKIGEEVQSGAPGSDQSPHEMVVTVAESGQLSETAPVVDSLGGRWKMASESGRSHCLRALTLTRHPPLSIE